MDGVRLGTLRHPSEDESLESPDKRMFAEPTGDPASVLGGECNEPTERYEDGGVTHEPFLYTRRRPQREHFTAVSSLSRVQSVQDQTII